MKAVARNEPSGAASGSFSEVRRRLQYRLRLLLVYRAKQVIIRIEGLSASGWDGEGCA